MSILTKPLPQITLADLQALVDAAARETDELEFKGDLPFKPSRGTTSTSDRWYEHGDRIGEYARDKLLAEIVAFANADGGTLILGLHETKDEPRRAERLDPLPNCESLAKRLADASEDVIEPRLPVFGATAIPSGLSDGSGFVIMKVGKSIAGPHRLKSDSEFYVRRGERAARMNVREIKERVLELARTGDKVEQAFQTRQASGEQAYLRLLRVPTKGMPAVHIRATALPISPQNIENLTRRRDLWWSGERFSARISDKWDADCAIPANEFSASPTVRLRSFTAQNEIGLDRLLCSDGTVEFSYNIPTTEPYRGSQAIVFWPWLIGLVAGTVAQVDRLKSRLAWDSVEFGLEVELKTAGPLRVFWDASIRESGAVIPATPLLLPRYSIATEESYDDILGTMIRDVMNAAGIASSATCSVPWDALIGSDDE